MTPGKKMYHAASGTTFEYSMIAHSWAAFRCKKLHSWNYYTSVRIIVPWFIRLSIKICRKVTSSIF